MGPGVKIRCKITLGHLQKREETNSPYGLNGTFSDLSHLLEGVERSELVLGGLDTFPEVEGGLYWVLG